MHCRLLLFRDPNDGKGLVFGTAMGTAPVIKHSNNWLKETTLKTLCSTNELKSLTAKSWRKGWANWGQDHPDPELNCIAFKVMCHSQEVMQSNYNVVNLTNASRFAKCVLKTVQESVEEDEDDEGEVAGEVEVAREEDADEEEDGDEDIDDVTNKVRISTRFSSKEKSIIKDALCVNGEPPKSLAMAAVNAAMDNSDKFKRLYKSLVKSKGGRKAANNTIRKSIMKKVKK
jgi:hypothetical protein